MLRSAVIFVAALTTLGIPSGAGMADASPAGADVIRSNDRLYLYGGVIDCAGNQRLVDYGKVTESGQVTLRGITLPAVDRTPADLAAALAEAMGAHSGFRPESLTIFAVRAEDYKTRSRLSLRAAIEMNRGCPGDKPLFDVPAEFPDDRFALRSSGFDAQADAR